MVFEGQYLSYEDYTTLGGTLAEAPFDLLEFEARRLVDLYTFNRLKDAEYTDLPNEVKLCVYKLIDNIQSFSETETAISSNKGVSSENIDGYSVSYITSSQLQDIVNSKKNTLEYTIREYLLGVIYNGEHLMYIGAK